MTGTDVTQVEWSANGGTISAAGLFTAPAAEGTYRVTAASVVDRSRTATATVRVRTPTAASSAWVTGYYAGWYWHAYPPERVDMTAMTHFVFGRIAPGSGTLGGTAGQLVNGATSAQELPGSPYAPQTVEDYLVSRAHASGRKALIMLGGAGDGVGFYNSTADGVRRTFVVNLVNYMVQHDYDGIDVDWEDCLSEPNDCQVKFPAAEAQRRLKALIAEIRAEANARPRYQGAGRQVIITFPWYAKNINFLEPGGRVEQWEADIANMVDQFNLMSYGMAYVAGGWRSWLSTPIYGATGETPYDLDTSIRAYVATGVPRRKIGIGIGFYGIFYSPDITAPRQLVTGATSVYNDDNSLAYNELRENGYLSRGTYHWDAVARVGYRSYNRTNGFPNGYRPPDGAPAAGMLSYEDEASIRAKGAWVRDPATAVGGTILWTINYGWQNDTQTNPLLDEVKRSFLQ
ncbi:hypothetical protein ASD25_06510 [Brevundimonas sp. Root1423]|nr:hypothetical protein ASD25_06510 [Brevundimonas sp. Root1423]